MGSALSVGLHRGVSHGHHPLGPRLPNRRLPRRSGNDRLWLRSRWLRGTTFSSRPLANTRPGQTVDSRPYRRHDRVLWTVFYVDNAHLFPGLKELPTLPFWVLPSLIALPFLGGTLSRFAPKP